VTVRVPRVVSHLLPRVVTIPEIRYVQNLTQRLDVATVRNTVKRQLSVKLPPKPRQAGKPGAALSYATRAAVAPIRVADKKHLLEASKRLACKCNTRRSQEQKRQSRKFFSGYGSRGFSHSICSC